MALYATTDGMKSRGACAVRLCGLVLYALIALGMAPRKVEAIVLGLLIVMGVQLTWFGLTESRETAGA